MDPIRVLIVDDHTLFRDGLCLLLRGFQGIQVVAALGDGREALSLVAEHRPDILLAGVTMRQMSGLELTRQVTRDFAPTRVLILGMHDNEEFVTQALQAGAAGYLLKDSNAAELEIALRTVASGEFYLSQAVSRYVVSDYLRRTGRVPSGVGALTPRQSDVLRLLAAGVTNMAIANQLGISVKTVESHRANLMRRLGIHDVAGLVRYAIRVGLIGQDQ